MDGDSVVMQLGFVFIILRCVAFISQQDASVDWPFLEEKGRDLFGAGVPFTPRDTDDTPPVVR